MALARTLSFAHVRILLGTGESPEQFFAPCGLNVRTANWGKALNEVNVPDCDLEDAPAWVGREVQSLTWSVSGDGVISEQSIDDWESFFNSAASRSVRIEFDLPTFGLLAFEGKAHLSTYNLSANRGEKAGITIELQGDGELLRVTERAPTLVMDATESGSDTALFDITTSSPPAPLSILFSGGFLSETAEPGDEWGTLIAEDPSDSGITWSELSDPDGVFDIDPVTGVVTLPDGAVLDFEVAASHALSVRAMNGLGQHLDADLFGDVLDFDEETEPAAPENTVAPFITGTTQVDHVLTVNPGTWLGNAIPGYLFQWKRNGVAIAGAVAITYLLKPADLGTTTTCTVTGRNQVTSVDATTAGVGPITASEFTLARYIAPAAVGLTDGSSWSNAGAMGKLSQFIGEVGPDGIVYVRADAGNFTSSLTTVSAGGTVGHPVTIRGVDVSLVPRTATFSGSRTHPWPPPGPPAPTVSNGSEQFRLLAGANNLSFEFMGFLNCGNGCFRIGDNISNLNVETVTATNVRRLVENTITGTAVTATLSGGTFNNIAVHGFSRAVMRLAYDSNSITISNVYGDSEYQDGDNFAAGIVFEDTCHDITLNDVLIERCMFSNVLAVDPDAVYWQGDGYSTEGGCYDITFTRCQAYGCADGGFDCKGGPIEFIDCIVGDCKRNYRIWNMASMNGCQSREPRHRGGTGDKVHIWRANDGSTNTPIIDCALVDSDAGVHVFSIETGGAGVWEVNVTNTSVETLGTLLFGDTARVVDPDFTAAPTNSVLPALSGTNTAGQTKTCTTGTWSGEGSGFTYYFQWKRNGFYIPDQTFNTYVLQSADIGQTITCTVFALDEAGYLGKATSASAGTISGVAPAFTSASTIAGLPRPGATLRAIVATATGFPAPTHTIIWQRDGVDIGGPPSITYTALDSDIGKAIRFKDTIVSTSGSANQFSAAATVTAKVLEELYVGPAAAGLANGSSWANQGEVVGSLDSFISGVLPGSTIYIAADQGDYAIGSGSISLHFGGDGDWDDHNPDPANFITVRGVDADLTPNHAVFRGNRTVWANYAAYVAEPETRTSVSGWNVGNIMFTFRNGANYLNFDHIRVENSEIAFNLSPTVDPGGGIDWLHHIHLTNIETFNVRRGSECAAFGAHTFERIGCVLLENWNSVGYSKDGLRIRAMMHDVLVKDCYFDSGRQDRDNFCEGVQHGETAHNVEFINVTVKNSTDTVNGYRNGDGFSAESGNYNLFWKDCTSTGHYDAGIDTKQDVNTDDWISGATSTYRTIADHGDYIVDGGTFDDCKKGLKTWRDTGKKIKNATISNAHHRGGSGARMLVSQSSTEFMFLELENCTLAGDSGQIFEMISDLNDQHITLTDCVVDVPETTVWCSVDGLGNNRGYIRLIDCTGTRLDAIRTAAADATVPTFRSPTGFLFLDGNSPKPNMPLHKEGDVLMFMGLFDYDPALPVPSPSVTQRFDDDVWTLEPVVTAGNKFGSFIGWRRMSHIEIGPVWTANIGNEHTAGFAICAAIASFGGCVESGTPYEDYQTSKTPQATVTISIATPGVVTWTGHGLIANAAIMFSSTGALPTGIVAGTTYYVSGSGITTDTFKFAATTGGAQIATSGSQSGVHTGYKMSGSNTSPTTTASGDDRAVLHWLVGSDDNGIGVVPAGFTQLDGHTSSVAGDAGEQLTMKGNVDSTTSGSVTTNAPGSPHIRHTFALLPSTADIMPTGIAGTWTLDFEDVFPGSSIDTSKWRANWLGGSDGVTTPGIQGTSGEVAYAPAQVTVSGGICTLSLVATPTTVSAHVYPNRSGIIQTAPHYSINPTAGHPVAFEARIWLDSFSPGMIANFPAWWANGFQTVWPDHGENDFMEGLDGEAASHIHYGPSDSGAERADDPPGDCTGWHVWGAKVTGDPVWKIEYFRDGTKYAEVIPRGTDYLDMFDNPMYLIINLASRSTDGVQKLPSTLKIDYVRVWTS